MKRVAIVGAGEIGAAVARALAEREVVREVTLINQSSLVASGKALDILQSGPLEGSDTRVIGAPDLDAVVGTDVVVIADRHGAPGNGPETTLRSCCAASCRWPDVVRSSLLGRVTRICWASRTVNSESTRDG